jgi:monovalent cation:H+ antiporter-2, CPA2 family
MSILGALVALLAAVVLVVALCRRLQLPSIFGYLAVGLAVGPHALGLIADNAMSRLLAEIGVVFLLFSIGLEFSLQEAKAMGGNMLKLGFAQVFLTALVAAGIAMFSGIEWQGAIAVGAAFAISSTAIGSKMLTERSELMSDHGKRVVGVLLFQDLAVIPFLVLLPTLARGGNLIDALGLAAMKAALALALILKVGRPAMRWWMRLVAARKSQELFMLNILLVTLGLAWITEIAGLSLALGAFLAGMLIAETEFRYQVEEDIKPFRDVLLGFFFVTLGMQLNIPNIAPQVGWVLLVLLALFVVKFAIIFGVLKLLHAPLATRLRTSIYLSQAGEFSFVLITLAFGLGTLPEKPQQILLAAMLLSLLLSPLLIAQSDKIVRKLTANDWMARAVALTQMAAKNVARQDHVLICGYGRSGQFLARLMEAENIPWFALDNDPQRVREANTAGSNVSYGDATRAEALAAAGAAKAKAVVITFSETEAARRIIRAVRKVNANVPIIVRTVDDAAIEPLMEMGATEVVPEVLEGSLMLASQAMLSVGTPLNRVLKRIRAVREQRYSLFRGFFHGASDTPESDEAALRLHAIVIAEGAACIGKSISGVALPTGVSIQSARRNNASVDVTAPDFALQAGDRIVLLGNMSDIALAQQVSFE